MLIYGRNPVLEALRDNQVTRLFVADGIDSKFTKELEMAAFESGVELEWYARIELDCAVKTTNHQDRKSVV